MNVLAVLDRYLDRHPALGLIVMIANIIAWSLLILLVASDP